MFNRIKEMVLSVAEKLNFLPPLLARLVIGYVFITSGWGKLHDLDKVIGFFTQLGIPAPQIQAPFVASVELVGGILVFIGLFTRLAALPLVGTMVVAIITAKLKEVASPLDILGFSEFDYIVLLSWLFTAGAGFLSIDKLICKRCVDNKEK